MLAVSRIPLRLFLAGGIFFASLVSSPPARAELVSMPVDFQSPQWRALLHQNRGPSSIQAGKPFFLSETGHLDPVAEGNSNLAEAEKDSQWACRFPARAMVFGKVIPKEGTACEAWWRWKEGVNAASAEIVFAAAYINSPSSMYGHTLLKFPRRGKTAGHELLDYTLNFGAVTGDVVGLPYVWMGLTGGFSGLFSMAPFYLKVKEYNHVENRDFWIYPLNLKSHELELLIAHAYELRDAKFPYYFLKKNCAYFLLDLLEVVRPGQNLTAKFPLWAVPLDTIRLLEKNSWLSREPYWRPSRLTKIEYWRKKLGRAKRNEVEALVLGKEVSQTPSSEVAHAAFELWRFRTEGKSTDKEHENRLLSYLAKVELPREELKAGPPPTHGHRSSRIGLGGGMNEKKNFAQLEFRGALHDLLSSPIGYEPQSELSMGLVKVRWEEGSLLLEQFDLLRLRSLQASHEWNSPWAWSFRSGVTRAPQLDCKGIRCSLGLLQGGIGKSVYVGPILGFLLSELEFSAGGFWARGFRGSLGAVAGLQWDLGVLRFMSEAERRWAIWGGPGRTEQWTNSLGLDLWKNQELRLASLHQKRRAEYKLAWLYYF